VFVRQAILPLDIPSTPHGSPCEPASRDTQHRRVRNNGVGVLPRTTIWDLAGLATRDPRDEKYLTQARSARCRMQRLMSYRHALRVPGAVMALVGGALFVSAPLPGDAHPADPVSQGPTRGESVPCASSAAAMPRDLAVAAVTHCDSERRR
jgi:hypothetical protein